MADLQDTESGPSTDRDSRDFLARYGSRALILGGSEGIGAAFAEQLAAQGFDLTLVARTASHLEEIAATIRARHAVDVTWHALDLAAPSSSEQVPAIVASGDHGLLIYNAGAAHGVGLFLDQAVDRALHLVRLNCIGPVAWAHAALRSMRERGRGGLILVSSMSGMVGSGYVAAYAACKSFEMILAEGLHWELARSGVDVMCAVATLTDTPAMVRSGLIVDADPSFVAMDPADVAAGALAHLGLGPVWFAAGDAAAATLRGSHRPTLSDAMSRTSARMWGIAVED